MNLFLYYKQFCDMSSVYNVWWYNNTVHSNIFVTSDTTNNNWNSCQWCCVIFMYLLICFQLILLWQDPAIATSKRVGDALYESYDRGTAKNAWVTESDGVTPLIGEVSHICAQT